MPKLGRPSYRDKSRYMFDEGSEVTRNAPFGTTYTPKLYTKIVGSRYKKFLGDSQSVDQNDSPDEDTTRSGYMSPGRENFSMLQRRPILPPIYSESQRDYDLNELTALLPSGSDLPQKSIQLKNNEQLSLLKLIKYEVKIVPDFIPKIKETYLSLARIDVNLTGFCSFKEFIDACHQNNVHLSWKLFRIVASQFLVPNRDDASFVHYENIISFLGAVYRSIDVSERCTLKTPSRSQSVQKKIDRPVYYHDEHCIDVEREEKSIEDSFDVDDSKIMKQINEDVGFHPIPLQGIRMAFQRADGLHRGTLSANQISDIFNSEGLILRKDSFNKLMHRCKYKGGGQYSWQQLVDFLERIQPISTGLQIPSSRMPIDYMKTIPAPASSWPHAEAFNTHHHPSENRSPLQESNIDRTPRQHRDFSQQGSSRPFIENEQNTSVNSTATGGFRTPRVSESRTLEPWFNRFLKFVDSVYLKDVNSQGMLPTRELYEISSQLNNQLGLNLTATEMISALEGSAVDNDRLYANINSYLKRLAIR